VENALRAFEVAHAVAVRDRVATAALDLVHHLLRGPAARTGAVEARAERCLALAPSRRAPPLAPVPSKCAPRSFTTTFAPSLAKRSASSRPMPRPAPVTIATLPSSELRNA